MTPVAPEDLLRTVVRMGEMTLISGGPSTGKTLLLAQAGAMVQRSGLKVFFIDFEGYAQTLFPVAGLGPEGLTYLRTSSEDNFQQAARFLQRGDAGIVLMDNINAASTLSGRRSASAMVGFEALKRNIHPGVAVVLTVGDTLPPPRAPTFWALTTVRLSREGRERRSYRVTKRRDGPCIEGDFTLAPLEA